MQKDKRYTVVAHEDIVKEGAAQVALYHLEDNTIDEAIDILKQAIKLLEIKNMLKIKA